MVDTGEAEKLFTRLRDATDSKSLLRKHLTNNIFAQLKGLKTKFGGTLIDCIRSGKRKLNFLFEKLASRLDFGLSDPWLGIDPNLISANDMTYS